jgi:hypothetical protein
MSEGIARVESIAELRSFKVALVKFVDSCNVALGDAESDMQKTLNWLERDQQTYWNGQLAKRTEAVSRAKDALRQKKLYKSPTGQTQSVVEEEKALRIAARMVEEAEQKIVACKQWARRLHKEIMMYKGGVTRMQSILGGDVPKALAHLEIMATSLEAYASLDAGALASAADRGSAPGAFSGEGLGSMSRSPDEAQRPDARIDVTDIRANVPPADVRAEALPTDIRQHEWALAVLGTDVRKALIALNPSPAPIDDRQTLTVAAGCDTATRLAIQHVAPADAGDSGWYLAPAGAKGIIALNKALVRDLLEIRPDLREILGFPDGFLVVLDAGGVRNVLNGVGEELWVSPTTE